MRFEDQESIGQATPLAPADGERVDAYAARFACELPKDVAQAQVIVARAPFDRRAWKTVPQGRRICRRRCRDGARVPLRTRACLAPPLPIANAPDNSSIPTSAIQSERTAAALTAALGESLFSPKLRSGRPRPLLASSIRHCLRSRRLLTQSSRSAGPLPCDAPDDQVFGPGWAIWDVGPRRACREPRPYVTVRLGAQGVYGATPLPPGCW